MRRLTWAMALAALSVSGCGKSDNTAASGNTGSETHWLVLCDTQAECGEGQCVCGVCTVPCTSDSNCEELGVDVDVECRATAEEPGCDTPDAPARVCLAAPNSEAVAPGDASVDGTSALDAASQSMSTAPTAMGDSDAATEQGENSTADFDSGGPGGEQGDAGDDPSGGDATPDTAAATDGGALEGLPSFDFPALEDPGAAFCSTVHSSGSEMCQGAANCPLLTTVSVNGVIRGIDAGQDGLAHALVSSESELCLLSVAPGEAPQATLNPFPFPEEAPLFGYPIAVDSGGTQHVFVSGEEQAIHYAGSGGSWSSETLTIPEHLDVLVHGAAVSGTELQIVYSAHLPDPRSAYNHTLLAGRSSTPGVWQEELLFDGQDELTLDDVTFPAGGAQPTAFWFSEGDARELFSWSGAVGTDGVGPHTEESGVFLSSVGQLSSGEVVLASIERQVVYATGPLHIAALTDGQPLATVTVPDTAGELGGCPVTPGSFMFGSSACRGFQGQACTDVRETVGLARWAQTDDGTNWLVYTQQREEQDLTLYDDCFEAEIDAGCYCNSDPAVPVVRRVEQTLHLARVGATADAIEVSVVLQLRDIPNLRYFDAQGSTLQLAFDNQLILLNGSALE